MGRMLAACAAALAVVVVLDLLWLGLLARSFYQQRIGHLMAERPNFVVAGIFYLVFVAGVTIFAVVPPIGAGGWQRAAVVGALFGFFAYATYDLTNLATLKGWPVGLALIDMAWGTLVGAAAAAAGRALYDRLG
jgi:uncharacterized membrane protein